MEIPTVSSVLCLDIETLSLIIGYFEVFFGIVNFIDSLFNGALRILLAFSLLAMVIGWVLGVHQVSEENTFHYNL